MKKFFAILTALCLLCVSCAALADMKIPVFSEMSQMVMEDENTTIEESAFEGEWVLNAAFLGTDYVDEQTLAGTYGFNFMPVRIADGKIMQDIQNEFGEFVTREGTYEFDCGELHVTDDSGRSSVVALLEDGNIVVSVFLPGENDTTECLSVFMVHPAR